MDRPLYEKTLQIVRMKLVTNLVLRVCAATIAGAVLYVILSLLSLMPQVLDGPYGFNEGFVRTGIPLFVREFYPLKWFAYCASPLFGWAVFRASAGKSFRAETGFLCVLGLFLICAIRITSELVILNMFWALAAEEPSQFTIVINALLLFFLVVWILVQEVRSLKRSRAKAPPK